jgi:hypothetical protein
MGNSAAGHSKPDEVTFTLAAVAVSFASPPQAVSARLTITRDAKIFEKLALLISYSFETLLQKYIKKKTGMRNKQNRHASQFLIIH